jgi:hypothetical protein
MTKREQYLSALRNQSFGRLTWAPNFDHWLGVNTRLGTVPSEYRGLDRNGIVRAVGGTIWARASSVSHSTPDIPIRREELGEGNFRIRIETNKGVLTSLHIVQGGMDRSLVMHEHPIKTAADLPALLELLRHRRFKVDTSSAVRQLKEVGDDGIVIDCGPCLPFIEFGKTDAGWETGLYMWYDHRAAVEEVLDAYQQVNLEHIRLLAENTPTAIVHLGDNMDQLMVSPDIFKRYGLPFYKKAGEICHKAGKLLQAHWCGRTTRLLPLLPGSGLNSVEAIVTEPMSDLTVEGALASLNGQVVMQGGVPAVLMCPQGGTRQDLERYIRHIVRDIHPTRGFALGMGDNVPPNADFDRVRMVSDLVAEAYA